MGCDSARATKPRARRDRRLAFEAGRFSLRLNLHRLASANLGQHPTQSRCSRFSKVTHGGSRGGLRPTSSLRVIPAVKIGPLSVSVATVMPAAQPLLVGVTSLPPSSRHPRIPRSTDARRRQYGLKGERAMKKGGLAEQVLLHCEGGRSLLWGATGQRGQAQKGPGRDLATREAMSPKLHLLSSSW